MASREEGIPGGAGGGAVLPLPANPGDDGKLVYASGGAYALASRAKYISNILRVGPDSTGAPVITSSEVMAVFGSATAATGSSVIVQNLADDSTAALFVNAATTAAKRAGLALIATGGNAADTGDVRLQAYLAATTNALRIYSLDSPTITTTVQHAHIYRSGAWAIGVEAQNDTSAEAQAGLLGTAINLGHKTAGGALTSVANQALLFNAAGILSLQGHAGAEFYVGATRTVTVTAVGVDADPGAAHAILGPYSAGGGYAAVYLGVATPDATNFALAGNGTALYVNAPGGDLNLCYAGAGGVRIKIDSTGIGFYGAAGAARAADMVALTDSTGGDTSALTLVDCTTLGLADPAKVNNNVARLCLQVNKVRTALRATNYMA